MKSTEELLLSDFYDSGWELRVWKPLGVPYSFVIQADTGEPDGLNIFIEIPLDELDKFTHILNTQKQIVMKKENHQIKDRVIPDRLIQQAVTGNFKPLEVYITLNKIIEKDQKIFIIRKLSDINDDYIYSFFYIKHMNTWMERWLVPNKIIISKTLFKWIAKNKHS